MHNSGSDLLQSELDHQPEAALEALGVFHVCVQTVLQGGAKLIQPARRRGHTSVSTVTPVSPPVTPASRANTHNWLLFLVMREGSMFVTMTTKSLFLLLMEL